MAQTRQTNLTHGMAQPVTLPWARFLALAAGTLGGCLLISFAAQVRISLPGTDVPMTLQLAAVLLIGFLMPPYCALAAVALYLACGTAGLPLFAHGSAGLPGPTGGYLLGFAPGAWLVSTLSRHRGCSVHCMLLAGVVGVAAVFAVGVAWRLTLAVLFGAFDGDACLAVVSGLVPFVPKAAVELLLTVALAAQVRRHLPAGRSTWER